MNRRQRTTARLTREQLDEIVRRLVEAISPQRIILFGSHAHGEATRDSDVDLMVIVDDDGQFDRFESSRRGYAALRGSFLPVELHLRTAPAFDRRAAVPASFEHEVEQRGQVVYQRVASGAPAGRRRTASPRLTHSRHTGATPRRTVPSTKIEIVREWLEAAECDLKAARLLIEREPALTETGCFHCQQVAEKALKAFLQWHEIGLGKVHDLHKLIDSCVGAEAAFLSIRVCAVSLNKFALDPRYPGLKNEPTAERAKAAIGAASEVLQFVLNCLPKEIRV